MRVGDERSFGGFGSYSPLQRGAYMHERKREMIECKDCGLSFHKSIKCRCSDADCNQPQEGEG